MAFQFGQLNVAQAGRDLFQTQFAAADEWSRVKEPICPVDQFDLPIVIGGTGTAASAGFSAGLSSKLGSTLMRPARVRR